MNTPAPDHVFEVVPPGGKKQKDPAVPPTPPLEAIPTVPPSAVVTDDDTAGETDDEVDERHRKIEVMAARRPTSWGIRLIVLAGLLAVGLVTYGIYGELATTGHKPLKPVANADIASVDGLRHWAKDQQTWLNGTLLPDQQAQWKEIDALKAEVASLKSRPAAAGAGAINDRAITSLTAMVVVEGIALLALALVFIRFRFAKKRPESDEA